MVLGRWLTGKATKGRRKERGGKARERKKANRLDNNRGWNEFVYAICGRFPVRTIIHTFVLYSM